MKGVNCVTDEKYIQNQKDFIKRERRIILRDHWTISWGFLLLLALLVLITIIGYQHPNDWQETAITLDRFESVEFHRGSRLDIYDIDGTCYTINRNENSIKDHLSIGQQYTFTYANSFFRKIVMVIKIDDVDYLSYEDSVKYFRDYNAVFWIFNSLVIIGLAVVNIIAYQVSTVERKKKIRRYQKRIYDKEHKMK